LICLFLQQPSSTSLHDYLRPLHLVTPISPFTIVTEVIRLHSYYLNTPLGIHNVFYSDVLYTALTDPLDSQVTDDAQPGPVIIGEEEEYEIKRILGSKIIRRGRGLQK
jgi:hypothetical protein